MVFIRQFDDVLCASEVVEEHGIIQAQCIYAGLRQTVVAGGDGAGMLVYLAVFHRLGEQARYDLQHKVLDIDTGDVAMAVDVFDLFADGSFHGAQLEPTDQSIGSEESASACGEFKIVQRHGARCRIE